MFRGPAERLEINGGIVLLAGGAALIALACVFASKPTIAPIFAVFGSSMLILGAFYARIEGNIEATREGVKATVRALNRRAREQNLPPDVADEALERALRSSSKLRFTWTDYLAENRAKRVISEVQGEHERVVGDAARWLEKEGYEVRREMHGFDLIGSKGDSFVGVEVKVSQRIDVAAIRQVLSFSPPSTNSFRRVLVFPEHSHISAEALAEAVRGKVELLTVNDRGGITTFSS